jgi:hypothetical protein
MQAAVVGSALVGGSDHVLDGDAASGVCALYLPEVHPKLLGHLLGGTRSVGLLLLGLLLLLTAGGLLVLLEHLVYVLCQPEVLSRLIERTLERLVGVDHLLDLGLHFFVRDLLGEALELGAFALQLSLEPPQRLPEEVLGAVYGLLLHLLAEILWTFVLLLALGLLLLLGS